MAPRSTWKGYLRLSLVSVPVKAFTANTTDGGEIRLNQLHKECHSRIKYKKTCPIHGDVENEEIVSGYEYTKGQYVQVDAEELGKIRAESDKSVSFKGFIPAGTIDPVYFKGRTYYLVPDGPMGQKPYALLRYALEEDELHGLGQVVLSGREQLVLVRPMGELLTMSTLSLDSQVKKTTGFEDEIVATEYSKDELKLTRMLIDATKLEEFDYSEYKDAYIEQLTKLIEAKVEGREIVAAPVVEDRPVVNLLDALKQSVAEAGKKMAASQKPSSRKKTTKKPMAAKKKVKKKMAPSSRHGGTARATRKKKKKA